MAREEGPAVGPIYTMPITAMLKRLRLKMASLQSHRTQCCCCAVGVFAAMFGIFMLSAGICIVLNVTFMEVDTSGLPPDLHNENGKKIVGIILICVAIAFLGLSATVSILYFTLCSRKSQAPTITTSNSHSNQQRHNTNGAASGQDRPKSRDGPLPGQKRTVSSHIDGVQFSKSVGHLRSDYSKSKAYRGRKNAMSRSMLPPHQEEDPEAAKTAMELDIANEMRATRRHSQGKVPGCKDNELEIRGSSSVLVNSHPIILVQNNFMETQLHDTASMFDGDSVSNACSELYDEAGSMAHISPYASLNSGRSNKSYLTTHELGNFKQKPLEDWDLQPPPDLPHNIDVLYDLPSSDLTTDILSLSTLPAHQHQLLVVRPAVGADPDIASSSLSTPDIMMEEETDHLPDLSFTFGHHTGQTSGLNPTDQDSRSESRSSFNSAFSWDGDKPDSHEVDMFHKRIEIALEPGISE